MSNMLCSRKNRGHVLGRNECSYGCCRTDWGVRQRRNVKRKERQRVKETINREMQDG